ncbi:MAG: tyrosine-type recombinase/integrase [Alphaproteobacteria bacterium]|nr:tyrosine-type recombinase/integrase [Alphaproteobacteria bacterium]
MATVAKFRGVMPVRKGDKVYWYFRRKGEPLVPLPEYPGHPEFARRWGELSSKPARPTPAVAGGGSLSSLIERFLSSPAFHDLGDLTKRDYRKVLDDLRDTVGHVPYASVTRSFVIGLRDAHAHSNRRRGNYNVQLLRRLFNWAIDNELMEKNPADRVELLKLGQGYQPWTPAQVKTFLAKAEGKWRIAMLLGMHFGQRRGNIVSLDWSQYDGQWVEFPAQKGGSPVAVPVPSELKALLDAVPNKTGAIVPACKSGRPYDLDAFSNGFRTECERVGLKGVTFHGLRYTAAARMADAGATDEEIMSVTGHKTKAMVTKYAAKSRGRRRAERALAKVESANSILAGANSGSRE